MPHRPTTPTLPRALLGLLIAHAAAAAGAAAEPPPIDCSAAVTTVAMTECADQALQAATAAQTDQLGRLEGRLPVARRPALTRAQKAWLAWRTAHCEFESSGAADGSLRGVLRQQCAARMTRERTVSLAALTDCREGEVVCAGPQLPPRAPR
ncbi:MAG: lysozyme inhibitor LprI family protein [Rubrivivax sp.]